MPGEIGWVEDFDWGYWFAEEWEMSAGPRGGRVDRLYNPERIPGGIENQFVDDYHGLRMTQIALLGDFLLWYSDKWGRHGKSRWLVHQGWCSPRWCSKYPEGQETIEHWQDCYWEPRTGYWEPGPDPVKGYSRTSRARNMNVWKIVTKDQDARIRHVLSHAAMMTGRMCGWGGCARSH